MGAWYFQNDPAWAAVNTGVGKLELESISCVKRNLCAYTLHLEFHFITLHHVFSGWFPSFSFKLF